MNNYYFDDESGCTVREKGSVNIANFGVELLGVNEYLQNNGVIQKKYLIRLFNLDFITEVEIDVKEVEKFDYSSVHDSLLLSPTLATAAKEMAYYIKSQSKEVGVKRIHLFSELGWHMVNDRHFYCAGSTIIGACPENYKVSEELKKYNFEFDSTMSEMECIKHILQLMSVNQKVCSVVFMTGMLGVLRQLFLDAGVNIPCCFYLFGASQTRKTAVSNFATALYNRSNLKNLSGISTLRVSSTEFKTEECVAALKDATFILDDLFKEKDNRTLRDYERRVRNIIRDFADNSPRTTTRSSHKNNSQIIITAEYLLKSKTDVGRLMVLEVTEPIDSKRLDICQKTPLGVSSFYYHFIKWVAEKYEDIVEDIIRQFAIFRESSVNHLFGYERLYEQSFLLKYVFGLFLTYAKEVGYNIIDRQTAEKEFAEVLHEHFCKQIRIIKDLEKAEVEHVNFSRELIEMLNNKTIIPGEKGDDCFKKGNYIYITNKYFGIKLREKFKQTFSAKRVSAYFNERYISEVYPDNRQKRYNNKRYLKLNMTELVKDSKDSSAYINNLFYR